MLKDILDKIIDNNTDLEEALDLNENIPKELLQAYGRSQKANAGGVTVSSNTSSHNQDFGYKGNFAKSRRTCNWDYGNANYEKLSAQEALDYLGIPGVTKTQVAEKLPDLRFLYKLSNGEYRLAEWENHNGNIYYLYSTDIPWDKFHAIQFQGFRGKSGFTNDTKFAQKISDIEACIKCADIIYKTDEYSPDYYLWAGERADKRKEKKSVKTLGTLRTYPNTTPADELPAGYDLHKPYKNFGLNKRFEINEPDTGAHNPISRLNGLLISNNLDSDRWSLNSVAEEYFKPYFYALNTKNTKKELYLHTRNALKKLEREKDTYDEEVYNKLKEKFERKANELKQDYDASLKNVWIISRRYTNGITKKMQEFNVNVIGKYLKRWEELLEETHVLKQAIAAESSKVLGKRADEYAFSNNNLQRIVKNLQNDIVKMKDLIVDIQNNTDDYEEGTLEQMEQKLKDSLQTLDTTLVEWEELKNRDLIEHVKALRKLEGELENANAEYAELRKHETELKAQRAAKNKVNELDPKLTNIVKFKKYNIENVDSDNTNTETA